MLGEVQMSHEQSCREAPDVLDISFPLMQVVFPMALSCTC